MFTGGFGDYPKGLPETKGYSLIEFVISALLIAAIAALSLPTIQNFTPPGEPPGRTSRLTPASELAAPNQSGGESAATAQPIPAPGAGASNESGRDDQAASEHPIATQGGKAQ